MAKLAVLEHPRTFPPKKILLVVWAGTLLLALYALIASPSLGGVIYVWIVIALVALWQLWVIRWVQVDEDGIRSKNLFQRGRELRWEEITVYNEEEVRLSKHPYIVLHLSNGDSSAANKAIRRLTRLKLTSDQVGFESLRTIVREAVPKVPANLGRGSLGATDSLAG